MSYNTANTKDQGLPQVESLVEKYSRERNSFRSSSYKETPLRTDFLDPFLMSLGWDVNNFQGKSQYLRDVEQEESIDIEDEVNKKNPDYTLRIRGDRKFFVEAKKPSVDVSQSKSSAFQVRRYGWNAGMGISVLSNFDQLIIYDCRYKPDANDDEHVARVKIYNYDEYVEKFDEIYGLLSYEAVKTGKLEEAFSVEKMEGEVFDDYFLDQIEKWRGWLAESAIDKNENLTSEEINFLIQRLLNRVIFLRICEDRTIENFEVLKNVQDYSELKEIFLEADGRYNSGLFNFIEDQLSLNIEVDSEVLISIFKELYYPLSPYNFSVVDPALLSQIYERFLARQVVLQEDRSWNIVEEPEVVASNGVVPTPKAVVDFITSETLEPLMKEKSLTEIRSTTIADISCGSGSFLLSVFDFLMKQYSGKFSGDDAGTEGLFEEREGNVMRLTLKAKREILLNNIFGVDINPYAVEVTEFSLLLKLLEDETKATIENFLELNDDKVLPDLKGNIKCGNSLVDNKFFDVYPEAVEDMELIFKIKPFEFEIEFPTVFDGGGFDAIVGNPPYVRIQNMKKYSPLEKKFYSEEKSSYSVAKKGTIDKYYLFFEKSLALLGEEGRLGYITPHKFFLLSGGKTLREHIRTESYISKILHFGVQQVFPGKSTYTAVIVLQKEKVEKFPMKRIKKISPDSFLSSGYKLYDQEAYKGNPWIFLNEETEMVFNKIRAAKTEPLEDLADICVGLQTSRDPIFIIFPEDETEDTYLFEGNGETLEIEKNITLPCIKDLSFNLYEKISPNSRIIFPYHIEDGRTELMSPQYLQDNFPLCWSYLLSRKDILKKRNLQGTNPVWYQFGRSQSLNRFHDTEKLIWPVLSKDSSYGIDNENIMFTGGGNGPYYSLISTSSYSLLYFMAILSHPVFERMVRSGASDFQGNYYSHGKQFISQIPIKTIDPDDPVEVEIYNELELTVNVLMQTKEYLKTTPMNRRRVYERHYDVLRKRLIEDVNRLYSLTEDDLTIVMEDPMFSEASNLEEENGID